MPRYMLFHYNLGISKKSWGLVKNAMHVGGTSMFCKHCYLSKMKESVSHSLVSNSLWPQGLYTCQVLLSMEFSRQEYWSGFPFPSPGDLPYPGIKPRSAALQADSLPSKPPGKLLFTYEVRNSYIYGFFTWRSLVSQMV